MTFTLLYQPMDINAKTYKLWSIDQLGITTQFSGNWAVEQFRTACSRRQSNQPLGSLRQITSTSARTIRPTNPFWLN